MEIRALELENTKSYERETIAFARGTNAICGPNGAGKSTILEAIGFALFDVAPCRPIASWVREGERTATIAVTVAASDEREYQVVRKCGGQNHYYVYDPEIGQKLADGPGDVVSWLKEQFGVEETVNLEALFRDAVGVPQGLLTAAFLDKPANRKSTFDPLLRVEEYNQAFARLLDSRRALDEQVQALEVQIAGYRAEVKELPRLESETALLAQEVDAAEGQLARLAPELASLEDRKKALEAARDRLRELGEGAARLDGHLAGLAEGVQKAAEALQQARAAGGILAESQVAYCAFVSAQDRRRLLEEQERARAQVQQAVHQCETRQQVKADRIRRLAIDLQVAVATAAEAEGLQPMAQEQQRLERELLQAQAVAQQWQTAKARLERERRRLAQLKERLKQVDDGLAERQGLERERQELEGSLESLNEALKPVRADEAGENARLEQLRAQSEALSGLQAAQCPVCESELPAGRRAELLDHNRQQIDLHGSLLAGLRGRASELTAQAQSVAEALRALQERLSRLPRPAERDPLLADGERQQAVVVEAEQELGRLAAADEQAQVLQARLAQLGDPRAAYQAALAIAGQRAALAANLEGERSEAVALVGELVELEQRLGAFGQLDREVAAVREELQANEAAHQRYLQHEREAGELPARQARLNKLQAELEEAQGRRQTLEQELQAAQAAYQREEYDRISAAYLQASEERSRLEIRVQLQGQRLEESQARMAELRSVAGRLEAAERDLAMWRELGHLLDYLRKVLKEAGPQVTRALVEIISLQAARLYADITNDQTGRLRWSEDYDVLVRHGAYERSFHQLSGGEQTAAALAVRLALLREVSKIDVVFFDEPTSNLDDTRRDNLADQILGIKCFTQLFVVSHDDTFERATDHTVRIAKEDGKSRAVA